MNTEQSITTRIYRQLIQRVPNLWKTQPGDVLNSHAKDDREIDCVTLYRSDSKMIIAYLEYDPRGDFAYTGMMMRVDRVSQTAEAITGRSPVSHKMGVDEHRADETLKRTLNGLLENWLTCMCGPM